MIEGIAIAPARPLPCRAQLGFGDALARLLADARPTGAQTVALDQAAGRILAAPVAARLPAPRTDAAAMDGYAVRSDDLDGAPVYLQIVDRAFPDRPAGRSVQPGQAVRIFTGASMPAGADRVVVQEQGRPIGDGVILDAPCIGRRHVREAGCDFSEGQILLPAGRRLDAQALMVAAAGDCGTVRLWRQPRVALLATGDEIAAPGEAAATRSQLPDSISLAIQALCREHGATITAAIRVPDDASLVRAAAARLIDMADIVIVSGGASVGERDHSRAVLADLGMRAIFAGVAMKPGKPVWHGRVGAVRVIGLPGNPAAALMAAHLFLRPLLRAMTGLATAGQWISTPARAPIGAAGAHDRFLWARRLPDGVQPLSEQQASMQHMLAQADAIIHLPCHHPGGNAGMMVEAMQL